MHHPRLKCSGHLDGDKSIQQALKNGMETMDGIDGIGTITGWNQDAMGYMKHTWTGIRVQHGNSLLASTVLEEALLRTVLGGACQPREVDQHGDLLCLGLRGQVEVEFHFTLCSGGGMAQLEELSAKGSDGSGCGDRHDVLMCCSERREKEEREKETEAEPTLWWGEIVPHEGKFTLLGVSKSIPSLHISESVHFSLIFIMLK